MRISFNWLKQYISTDLQVEEVGQRLTDSGLEVEGIEEVLSVEGGLEGIVIGHILETSQHPNADRLTLTKVDIGSEVLDIVCGAPNVAKDQKVVVATVGSTLYPAEGEAFKIKKGKIRGEVSMGMICAEDEIGLGQSHDGIMVLDSDVKAGTAAAEFFKVERDHAIEIGLTPNRTDGMSHIGVARDLAAVLSLEQEKKLAIEWPSIDAFKVDSTNAKIEVEVKDYEACPRYAGIRLSNAKVGASPEWLQNRLKSIGLAPINNVVDITNYVLHELGQPLHAFDADKIAGNKVVVQTLSEGTKFTTLDEKERELNAKDLMICDAEKGMCIAGVFGGIHSGVSEETTEIFLESAYFNPVWIRKAAKRHILNTDASFRFERGVDPELTVYALKRAAMLIKEITGAEISSDIIDIYPNKIEPIQLNFNKINGDRLIGKEIPEDTVESILDSLDIEVLEKNGADWSLKVPRYRADVTREADVVEEILRIYGFNNIELPAKIHASLSYSDLVDKEKIKREVTEFLVARGFNEMMSNSLTSDRYVQGAKLEEYNEDDNVAIFNPLSSDLNVMRQSLVFNGLEAIAYNQNRQQGDLHFFEFGNVYKHAEAYQENFRLAIHLSGAPKGNWRNEGKNYTFFDIKAMVNSVLKKLGLYDKISVQACDKELYDEGLTYSIGKNRIVDFGRLSKDVQDLNSIKQRVFHADFDWDMVFSLLKSGHITYKELPKFPAVHRDLSLLIDKDVAFEQIYNIAFKTDKKLLKEVDLFDVYEGDKLPSGKKSYAVSFTIQDESKTLKDKTVDKLMTRIFDALKSELGASLR